MLIAHRGSVNGNTFENSLAAFIRANNDIKYDWSEKIKFDIWDIVYWRSQKTDKFAIAIFYWNTKFDNFNSPSAVSPAIKIWEIKWNFDDLKNILNDTFVSIEINENNRRTEDF